MVLQPIYCISHSFGAMPKSTLGKMAIWDSNLKIYLSGFKFKNSNLKIYLYNEKGQGT